MTHGPTCATLFSGAECAGVGLERAGFKIIWHSEIAKAPCAVLRFRYPGTSNLGNVSEINPDKIEAPFLLWMSPPCQDLSINGKRAGLSGDRSRLFYEGTRIANNLVRRGTRFVVMEQVPGLLTSHRGNDFRDVLLEFLELRPVDLAWRVLDSQWFGVAQRRSRLYFVLDFGGERASEILALAESLCRHPAPVRAKRETASERVETAFGDCGYSIPEVACTLGVAGSTANDLARLGAVIPIKEIASNQWSKGNVKNACGPGIGNSGDPMYCLGALACNIHGVAFSHNASIAQTMQVFDEFTPTLSASPTSNPAVCDNWTVRRITPLEGERLQGLPDHWTRWGIDDKGNKIEMSDTARYSMIGNGVTANKSEWIARRILEATP